MMKEKHQGWSWLVGWLVGWEVFKVVLKDVDHRGWISQLISFDTVKKQLHAQHMCSCSLEASPQSRPGKDRSRLLP